MRISRFLALAGIISAAALCQQTPGGAPVAFEVASIKASAPMTGKMMQLGVRNDGAMVTYSNMSLKDLVQNAYRVKDYQVTAPEWMSIERFDISAKLPDGASQDQAPEMLQALLKERFKLTSHAEKKDHAIYALVVGKGGPKLKVPENAPAVTAGPGDGAAGGRGASGGPPPGAMTMRMGPGGGHIEARAATVGRFAETISRFMDRPVIDQTGIEGNYDFAVDVSPEEMGNMMAQMKAAGSMAMAARGGPAPGGPAATGPEGPPNAPEGGGSVFQSIQQYGLKLEPKKASMDMIVVDTAEKTPTDN
jgi:uncharacterized protein (TIGR03435 family)